MDQADKRQFGWTWAGLTYGNTVGWTWDMLYGEVCWTWPMLTGGGCTWARSCCRSRRRRSA
eukprot:2188944-Rhodomonas_salina.2